MKIIFLGTGSPTPNPNRCGTSAVVLVDRDAILIDCGGGTTHQLVRAKVDPSAVNYLFFTHHHFDHNVDYAHFVLASWIVSRKNPLNVYGPKGTEALTETLFEKAFINDIKCRVDLVNYKVSEGLNMRVQDIDEDFTLEKESWRLTSVRVDHFDWWGDNYTLGYRLEARGKSIVFSGDTAPCDSLIRLAKDADILVQEVFWAPELVTTATLPGRHRKYPSSNPADFATPRKHTLPEEAGKIAKAAGVKKMVLTHFFSDTNLGEMTESVRRDYPGEIILAADLMEIQV